MTILPVILSGGAGSRLWPLSRESYPKQLLPLVSEYSLLQETVRRASRLPSVMNPLLICNEAHRLLIAEQLKAIDIQASAIILEPKGRNTAPAIIIAALHALHQKQDPLLLVLPSDHVIKDQKAFERSVCEAEVYAEEGKLITFGIVPTSPETGYGYIKLGSCLKKNLVYQVEAFVEKPTIEKAKQYLNAKTYFWNSGIFLFKASAIISEIQIHAPKLYAQCEKAFNHRLDDDDYCQLDLESFLACQNISIDYAVMEKTDNAIVVPIEAGWSDIGSWSALYDIHEKNSDGNVICGNAVTQEVRDSYLRADKRLLAVMGVHNLVIVETGDVVFVADKSHSQQVKELVNNLKKKQRTTVKMNHCVYRPWGSYETIDQGTAFQVRRLMIKPEKGIALQQHHQRAEHWVVISGVARVKKGSEVFTLTNNQSTYIPVDVPHRIENLGHELLEVIEIQSGSCLGDDDIIRFEEY